MIISYMGWNTKDDGMGISPIFIWGLTTHITMGDNLYGAFHQASKVVNDQKSLD